MRQIDKILTFLQAKSIPVKKAVSWNRSFDAVESKMSNVVSSVMVFGATGETGKGVVKNLLQSPTCEKVIAIVRGPENLPEAFTENYKFESYVVKDFSLLADEIDLGRDFGPVDVAFCCIGTTLAKSNNDEFIYIERDLVKVCANFAKARGCFSFRFLSGFMSHPDSLFFVPRVKGEAEEALKAIRFRHLSIYRPGLLRCDRSESRPMEAAARWISNRADFGDWWSIPTADVASVMVASSLNDGNDGVTVLEHGQIVDLASTLK